MDEEIKEIVQATSRSEDGNMSVRYGEEKEVLGNRAAFLAKHGFSIEDAVVMDVQDGAEVVQVGDDARGSTVAADALITDRPRVALFLLTGDCLPITCYDPANGAVGLAHGSRRSTGVHLIEKTLHEMEAAFGTNPNDVVAWIGPGVRKESYILDDPAEKNDEEWSRFLSKTADGKTAVDVLGYTAQQLTDAGVREENIIVSAVDTIASPEYFSHYRSVRSGEPEARFATVLGLLS